MNTSVQRVDVLCDAMSQAVGQALVFDLDGECCLFLENGIELSIGLPKDREVLSLRSPLAFVDSFAYSHLPRSMLEINYARLPPGYAVAIDPGSGQFVLIALFDRLRLPAEELSSTLSTFIQFVSRLLDFVRQCSSSQDVARPAFDFNVPGKQA